MQSTVFAIRCLAIGVLMTMRSWRPIPPSAQETVVNGAVFGTIIDESGGALPGVTVSVSGPSLQGPEHDH
jgi:hypothetical protein